MNLKNFGLGMEKPTFNEEFLGESGPPLKLKNLDLLSLLFVGPHKPPKKTYLAFFEDSRK